MNLPYSWIDCASWELDFFSLPHRIPWPNDVAPEVATNDPFELEHLVTAIELMGPEAEQPWKGFAEASHFFEPLSEALEDSEIANARNLLNQIEAVHPGTSFRLFHEAYIARHEGRLEDAIGLYKQAVEKTPGVLDIWKNLGVLLGMTGHRDEAVAAFRKILATAPSDHTALEGLAQLRELVKLIRDPNDPKSAMYVEIPTFRQMATNQITNLAQDPDQLLAYGEELFRGGIVPDVGLAALEAARTARPDHPRTIFAVASAYRTMGRLEEAHASITQLTQLLPDNAEAYFHLAQVNNAMGNPEAERAALTRTLELNPNVQSALGIWFELKPGEHDPKKEQQLVEFAEERKSWMAFVLASALCRERGDFPRAVRWAERAVEIEPESEEALLHLTAIIGDARDIQKLASAVKPKVDSGKFSKRLDWNYAHVLRQLGLTNDAVHVLRKAAATEGAPEDFKAACSTSLEAWGGLLAGTNVPLEVHESGVLLRDVLLRLEDDDGGVILNAGSQTPAQGVFPWRANASETSVTLQQGQTGSAVAPRSLGEFKVGSIQITPGEPATIECHLTALPDGALHFRAAQNGKRLQVGWAPPRLVA
ncbi:MAG: repeat-containing protein [Chthoniobacteraceae bacterium]|nr:repeat-containing protein [Chthoniobacteraceae bacterium]